MASMFIKTLSVSSLAEAAKLCSKLAINTKLIISLLLYYYLVLLLLLNYTSHLHLDNYEDILTT